MSYYTKLRLNCTLKPGTPPEIVAQLRHMALMPEWHTHDDCPKLQHVLFQDPKHHRHEHMLAGGKLAERTFEENAVGLHVELESQVNYGCEILPLFAAWLRPYLVDQSGSFLYTRDEEGFEKRYFANGRSERRNYNDYMDRPRGFLDVEFPEPANDGWISDPPIA